MLDLTLPAGTYMERQEAWDALMEGLFAWVRDALTQGVAVDWAQRGRDLTTWQVYLATVHDPLERDALERQWEAARGMLGCAEHAGQWMARPPDGTVIDRVCWALGAAPALLTSHRGWAWDCMRLLRPGAPVAPVVRQLDVPVAVADAYAPVGEIYTLRLEVLEPGGGDVFPHPAETLRTKMDAAFAAAMQHAWQAARRWAWPGESARLCDGRWRLLQLDGHTVREIRGSSAGGAAALGWYHVLRGTVPDEGLIVLTAVAPDGGLTGVGGVPAKVRAIATDGRFDTVVVATALNQAEATATLVEAGKLGPIRVVL